jgi:serine protease DegQ
MTGAEATGSGFIIEKNGTKYVITNAHVIENASVMKGSIFVFSITQRKYEMKVEGGDIIYDLAVLSFVTPPGSELTTLSFETFDPRIGEPVYAIGNPLAEFPYSVVDGIISAKSRTTKGVQGFQGKFGYIQTTATLIWGNSGGPLVNSRGNVAGVNSQLYAKQIGNTTVIAPQINFALEAKTAVRIINDIINNNGNVIRAFIGVEISMRYKYDDQSYYYAQKGFDLIDSLPVLSAVLPGCPAADKLNAKTGAQVLKINNVDVHNTEEVLKEFEGILPGQTVTLTLQQGKQVENISFPVQELNKQGYRQIALQIFEKQQNIKINEANGKVWITLNEGIKYDRSIENSERKYKSDYMKKMNGPKVPTGEWQIISAGIKTDGNTNMWFIKNLADLGAVVRIMGNMGYLDLVLQKNGYYSDNMFDVNIIFSSDSNIKKETIWY